MWKPGFGCDLEEAVRRIECTAGNFVSFLAGLGVMRASTATAGVCIPLLLKANGTGSLMHGKTVCLRRTMLWHVAMVVPQLVPILCIIKATLTAMTWPYVGARSGSLLDPAC